LGNAPLLVATVAALCAGCVWDDSDVVPLDQVPPEKRLVDLSPAEERGLCEWGEGVIRDKVAGRTIECNGNPIRFSGCLGASEACPATVGQWTDCIPNLLDALFADPCLVISFSFESEFQAFIDETPSCEGLGACGTVRQ
jgi:hypothetical protein